MSEILKEEHDKVYSIMDSKLVSGTGDCYVLFWDVEGFCNKILSFNVLQPTMNRLVLLDPLKSPSLTSLHLNWWGDEVLCIDEDGGVRAYLIPITCFTLKQFAKKAIRSHLSNRSILKLDLPRNLQLYLTL